MSYLDETDAAAIALAENQRIWREAADVATEFGGAFPLAPSIPPIPAEYLLAVPSLSRASINETLEALLESSPTVLTAVAKISDAAIGALMPGFAFLAVDLVGASLDLGETLAPFGWTLGVEGETVVEAHFGVSRLVVIEMGLRLPARAAERIDDVIADLMISAHSNLGEVEYGDGAACVLGPSAIRRVRPAEQYGPGLIVRFRFANVPFPPVTRGRTSVYVPTSVSVRS